MTHKVAVIRTAHDWQACFTGDTDNYHPGAGSAHVADTQTEAETAMKATWGDELAPTCTEEHETQNHVAYRCTRTDCPITYQKPSDAA